MSHARRKDDPRQLGLYPEKKPAAPREGSTIKPREIATLVAVSPEATKPTEPTAEDQAAEDRAEKARDAGAFRREGPPRNWKRRG